MKKDWAIVVGLNKYRHPMYPPLRGAVRDAQAVLGWLKKRSGSDFGEKDERIFSLIQKKKGDPRLDAFERAIEHLRDIPGRAGRRLYVYMSGHGIGKTMTDVALLAGDHSENKNSVLEARRYADMFCEIAAFEEVLLFMDCCRDRLDYRSRFETNWQYEADPNAAAVKQCYGFGSQFNRSAYEEKFGNAYHGVFSYYLLEGLVRGGAADENGRITAGDLEEFIKRQYEDRGESYPPAFHASDPGLVLAENVKPILSTVEIELQKPDTEFQIRDGKQFDRVLDVKRTHAPPKTWRVRLRPFRTYVITAGNVFKQVRPPEDKRVAL